MKELTFLDKVDKVCVFTLGLQRHQIHAVLSAEVSTLKPVAFQILKSWLIFGEEVAMSATVEMLGSCNNNLKVIL